MAHGFRALKIQRDKNVGKTEQLEEQKSKCCACYHVRGKEYNFCYGSPDENQTIELKNKMACVQPQGGGVFSSYG